MTKQLAFDFGTSTMLDRQAANEARGLASTFKARERDRFYRSKAWRRVRGIKLAGQGCRCQKCGSTASEAERIDVDHILQRSTHPHLALYLSNLQVLCSDCHEAKTYRENLRRQNENHDPGHFMVLR